MRAPRTAASAVLVALGLGLASASAAADLVPRTLSESTDGLRIELEISIPDPLRQELGGGAAGFTRFVFEGMQLEGSPGAPLLPLAVRYVAIPPGGSATLRVESSEITDLGVLRLAPRPIATTEPVPGAAGEPGLEMLHEEIVDDPVLYRADGPRLEPARLGGVQVLRHQEVVPLEIRPLLYDPQTGATRIVRRLRLAIDLRPGVRPAIGTDDVTPRLATGSSWRRIYDGLLVNAKAGAGWRRAARRTEQLGGPLKSGLLRPGLLAEEEWKIRVARTGACRVADSTLAAAGFPDGTPFSQLRLYLKRFDPARPLDPTILEIPIQPVDGDGDGIFDRQESFVFWGENVRDDATSEDPWARYAIDNVYWLAVATAGTPARMPVRARRAAAVPGPTVFDQRLVYEEDRVFDTWVYGSNTEIVDSSALYFWTPRAVVARVTVPVPGRAPGAALGVCVETQEDHVSRPYQLFVRTGSRDSVLLATNYGTSPPTNSAPMRQTPCGTALDSQIDPGDARIILQPLYPGGLLPFMDRVRLQYSAEYVAAGNRIRCTSGGAAGELAFAIGGFTDANLRAFDVTDPKSPAAFDLAGALAGGTLTLTDSVPSGSERVYVVVPDASIQAVGAELDHPDDILTELASTPAGTYDVLVVAHDAFAADPALARWVAFRESQGHRVRVVRTSDAYDAFRGGLQHYEAIHRLCQMAFTNWGVESVMLVGDGSEDPRHLLANSGTNFVPARVRYFYVGSSGGDPNEYRNDMNDKYYAQVAGPPNDTLPDLLLGRLPVVTSEQLAAIVDKTIAYETPQPGDDGRWRKRVVMFSDDEWVIRDISGVGRRHRRDCYAPDFQSSIARASETVDGAFPGDLRASRFFLRDFSDRLGLPSGDSPPREPLHRPVPFDSSCIYALMGDGQAHPVLGPETSFYRGLGTGEVGQALVDSIGAGALFFALQSHMNRSVVSDEYVINTTDNRPFHPPFYNDGKPFVAFGFGCHMNEFGPPNEYGGNFPGASLGEELLLVPSRGAVASYASTGYEFLNENNDYHEGLWRIIFEKRFQRDLGGGSVDSDTLQSRWLLSELLAIGEIQSAGADMRARYTLLGDPLLRLDAGLPRVTVERVDNGFLQSDNRLVIRDTSRPLGLEITLRDEQGIDSLWVVRRYPGGGEFAIDSVTTVANIDTAAQIRAKRSYTVSFQVAIATGSDCNFEVVAGARDLSGRRSEFVGRIVREGELYANGLPIRSGDRVDPRTAFRFRLFGCTPISPPLPLVVEVDGDTLPPEQIVLGSDPEGVNWNADFVLNLTSGTHSLRFLYEGSQFALYQVDVGGFGMTEILAFPNPMRKQHDVMRIYFHLGEPIAGGSLRVLDLNGRTVLKEDLANPGVVKSDVEVPAGSIGSGVGQDDTHWNYVEIFQGGRDREGDAIANGVYLYELVIRGFSGETQRKRDKIVIMR